MLFWFSWSPPYAALSTQIQNRLIKMPNRRWGLQAGVEVGGRINGSMAQYTADNLVGAGVGIEKQPGRDVSEKVGMIRNPVWAWTVCEIWVPKNA